MSYSMDFRCVIGEQNFDRNLQVSLAQHGNDETVINMMAAGDHVVEFGYISGGKKSFLDDVGELGSEDERIANIEFLCPFASAGSIGRKRTDPPKESSSKSSSINKPDNKSSDKTGNVDMLEAFVAFKGEVYYVFSSGGRYGKIAIRLLIQNLSYDNCTCAGLNQYAYLSGTGSHTAQLNSLKLGSTYKLFNLKYYAVSSDTRILNWKQGSYASIQQLKPEDSEFTNSDNYGSTFGSGVTTGIVRDVSMATICNCLALKGTISGETTIRQCGRCNSSGMILLESDCSSPEEKKDGASGPLTLVSIETNDGLIPLQILVHPNFTRSDLPDFSLRYGDRMSTKTSRVLNSKNLSLGWEIVGYTVLDETETKKAGEQTDCKTEL